MNERQIEAVVEAGDGAGARGDVEEEVGARDVVKVGRKPGAEWAER